MVLAIVLVGAMAFVLMLFSLGQGWTGGSEANGGSHARSNGLNGYAGLVRLLDDSGYRVELSRSRDAYDDYGLLVLTPDLASDPADIAEVIAQRQEDNLGPTLLILPKWTAMPLPDGADNAEPGWVALAGAASPEWFGELELAQGGALGLGRTEGWSGYGRSGDLPEERAVQALIDQPRGAAFMPMVVDSEADILAGLLPQAEMANDGYAPWPVVVVFEPDLMNNWGLADRARAQTALALIDEAGDYSDMPVIFDLTLPGLGASENLLTLAFSPPFLAATLCLLLAALVIGWRAFRRFGPPVAEAEAMARGKRQLASNGAELIERLRRFHLLKEPYEGLIARRVAERLGLRLADRDAREAAIDRVLAARGTAAGPPFAQLAADLRAARSPRDILRAAGALRTFERNLVP